MRKICYSVAMSLDGYVAGPNGEHDWILMDPEIDFGALFARFDTVLVGRRSFEAMAGQGGGGSMPGVKTFVASTTLRPEDYPKVTILAHDLPAAVSQLRAEPGKDIWLFGGGNLFRSLLNARLVDEVEVAIIPVLLGNGIPMLPPPAEQAKLRLVKHRVFSQTGTVLLSYEMDYRLE